MLLILLSLLSAACTALRDDLRRAETALEQARYEDAEVWLAELSASVPDMDHPSRVRFYYLRGISAFRLGERLRARHYLALCREESGAQGVGLRGEWRVNLAKVMLELEAELSQSSGGASPSPTAAVQAPATMPD